MMMLDFRYHRVGTTTTRTSMEILGKNEKDLSWLSSRSPVLEDRKETHLEIVMILSDTGKGGTMNRENQLTVM